MAATVIDGVAVDCGHHLTEQKNALKALVDDRPQGDTWVSAFVLYSSGRQATRKRITLLKGESPADAYKAGKKAAVKVAAARAKLQDQNQGERAESVASAKNAQAAKSAEIRNVKNKAKT